MKRLLVLMIIALGLFSIALTETKRIEPRYEVPLYVEQLLEVARGEIGYKERSDGYTKYGAWVKDDYAQWCAEFLCWSVNQTDEKHATKLLKNIYPLYGGQNTGMNWFIKEGRFVSRTGMLNGYGSQWYRENNNNVEKNSYIPQPGDWVFFSYTPSGDTTHVAMVEFASKDDKTNTIYVNVIEGNNPDSVQRKTYKIDDWKILGYGTVHNIADFTLRRGNDGKKVIELQTKLSDLGYIAKSDVNGQFAASTENAVMAFQQRFGLLVNGIANKATQLKINEEVQLWLNNEGQGWVVEGD